MEYFLKYRKWRLFVLNQEYVFSDINVTKKESANFDVDLSNILE